MAGKNIDFIEKQNPWSEYITEDGITLKIRHIVIAIRDTGETLPNGHKAYEIDTHPVFSQILPEKPIDKANLKKDT